MQLGDLMTMPVQPRHIKWYTGQQKDWELSAFELNERHGTALKAGGCERDVALHR
jgi:hypothetical protein